MIFDRTFVNHVSDKHKLGSVSCERSSQVCVVFNMTMNFTAI